ncbi:hypothetical protein JXI42_12880 [bacterium]|nr:hypothetical protein [bacterium]
MAKRIKKPPIRPEIRRNWLKRHEDEGESPPQIAEKDHYDVRTVRKQIELAKQEREVREARSIVLRDALEKHYEDLRKYAEKLNSQIIGTGDSVYSLDDDFIESALRQHLPRSPLWAYLSKWQSLQQRVIEEQQKIEENISEVVKKEPRLKSLADSGFNDIVPGIVAVLDAEVKQWLNGNLDYTLKDSLIMEPVEKGLVNPRIGFSHMGLMDKEVATENMGIAQDVLADLETRVKVIQEYIDLEKTKAEIRRLRIKLREELAVIRLRRIVPGRCKYCPL